MFSNSANHGAWNSRWAGKRAMTAKNELGYLHGPLLGRKFKAHRIAWAIETGEWPPLIDHINKCPSDNRLCNLRPSSKMDNAKNQKLPSRNTSGVLGVCWDKSRNLWEAKIKTDGKLVHLGRFVTLEEAAAARAAANVKYGFSENHGRAA
jgi:hypothetical protein